jgi:hypothetical protein
LCYFRWQKQAFIDEETPLAIVRHVVREGAPKTVRYSGPVDFVISHSKMASNMPKDAPVMVIKTKKSDTFDGSLLQATAQAAALLFFRQMMKPPRGLNGSGGPIIFIRTDGERWIFSKMTCEDGVSQVQHSDEFKINICRNTIENATVQKVFDWLRYAITISRDSSPHASMERVKLSSAMPSHDGWFHRQHTFLIQSNLGYLCYCLRESDKVC